jgi:hypothetical protein
VHPGDSHTRIPHSGKVCGLARPVRTFWLHIRSLRPNTLKPASSMRRAFRLTRSFWLTSEVRNEDGRRACRSKLLALWLARLPCFARAIFRRLTTKDSVRIRHGIALMVSHVSAGASPRLRISPAVSKLYPRSLSSGMSNSNEPIMAEMSGAGLV